MISKIRFTILAGILFGLVGAFYVLPTTPRATLYELTYQGESIYRSKQLPSRDEVCRLVSRNREIYGDAATTFIVHGVYDPDTNRLATATDIAENTPLMMERLLNKFRLPLMDNSEPCNP
jgi:hypothetical protein